MNRTGLILAASRRRLGHWVVLFALAFNLLGGGVLPSVPQVASLDGWVICSPTGMTVVGRDGSQENTEHAPLCAFCLPLMHAGLTPDPVIVLARNPHERSNVAFAVIRQGPPARDWTAGPSGPRAPPSV